MPRVSDLKEPTPLPRGTGFEDWQKLAGTATSITWHALNMRTAEKAYAAAKGDPRLEQIAEEIQKAAFKGDWDLVFWASDPPPVRTRREWAELLSSVIYGPRVAVFAEGLQPSQMQHAAMILWALMTSIWSEENLNATT